MSRLFHRLYAGFFGYFWLPCPKCGEMFGGHQVAIKTASVTCAGTNKVVCPDCVPGLIYNALLLAGWDSAKAVSYAKSGKIIHVTEELTFVEEN